MYCTSRVRLGTQHNATLTTQQSPAPHTPQRHTHDSRARLGTQHNATLTTQLRQQFPDHTSLRGAGPYPGCSVYLVLMDVIRCGILSGQNTEFRELVEAGLALLTITPVTFLENFSSSLSMSRFCGFNGPNSLWSFHQRTRLSPVTVVDSWALWVPCAKGPTGQRGCLLASGDGEPVIQCRQERIYLTPIFFRCLLVLLCPFLTVIDKFRNPSQRRTW